jgi:TRAP transporter TAXI family solute receptor
MSQRLAALTALFAFVLLVIGASLWGGNIGLGETGPGRISFQIATGSTEGLYFPVGQAMAGLISHPSGVARCETATVCGPAGVILSARTSEGAADNLRGVNAGTVDSGLSEGDVIAAAVAGQGPFRRAGRARHLRVIASLFSEQAHLVASVKSGIQRMEDLRGKRVMLGGAENTGAIFRSRAILAAFRVPEQRLHVMAQDTGNPVQLLREGKIDAFFATAGVPIEGVRDLTARGVARLVPLDGDGRDRLLRAVPQLSPATIAANAYPGPAAAAIETVATRSYWVTRDSEPDALIYGLARALFNPANHTALASSHPSAREITLDQAAENPPAPLHPGAARFYRETGRLAQALPALP